MIWVIISVLVLVLLILIGIQWAMSRWWNNGAISINREVIWRSRSGFYNPSIVEEGDHLIIACRKSLISRRNLVEFIPQLFYLHCRESYPDEMHIFDLDTETGQASHVTQVAPPWQTCMKYPLYEDPRIHRLPNGQFCMFATYIHKKGGKPQAILLLDPNFHVLHATSFDLRYQPRPNYHKNWTLFVDGENELCLLTDIHPFLRVQHVDLLTGRYSIKAESKSFIPYPKTRCTSRPVRWDDSTLMTAAHTIEMRGIHSNYQTLFVWFENLPPYRIRGYTPPMTFFDHSYVEFASGLAHHGSTDTFLLGLGLDDGYAVILRLTRDTLEHCRIDHPG